MKSEKNRKDIFTRRTLLLTGGQLGLFSILAGRMYYLQIIQNEKYKFLAEDNRINVHLIPPKRGQILDRYGNVLAYSSASYHLKLIRERTKSLDKTLNKISSIVPLEEDQKEKIIKNIRRESKFVPITVVEDLTWDQLAQLEVMTPDIPGVLIEEGQKRVYPYSSLLGHITGYVGVASEKDIKRDDEKNPLYQLPDFQIGKSGLEKTYNKKLLGKAGAKNLEVNAHGRIIRELDRIHSVSGENLKLSLDLELQKYAVERLGEQAGSVVVMDIHKGDILALVTHPSYDPNMFTRGLTHQEWKELSTDPRGPLKNKAVGGQYAPGSTFKMMVALAALENKVVTPRDRFTCRGYMHFGNRRFHCWKRGGHGRVDLNYGLKMSCDVYFYELSLKVGVDKIEEMCRKFGLNQLLGIDVPDEKPGLIPTHAWKENRFKEPWYRGETLSIGIGQGYTLTTPLQLAVMTARLANGGYAVKPHLFDPPLSREVYEKIDVDPKNLELIKQAMSDVVNRGGTAARSRILDPDMAMAGKTGTAQVRRITMADRRAGRASNKNLPWHLRDHGLFVGYAPVDKPQYAISVVVEHGGGGSSAAAPIAKDVMIKTQQRLKRKKFII